jgi:hypothetical protein
MALDTMLAADIEQQLKPLDAAGRAQFLLDLVEVVHNYASWSRTPCGSPSRPR